jgi:hypothetical protein
VDFDSAIPRFESWRPSQPVRSPPANIRRPLKRPPNRGISQMQLRLRVRFLATETVFWSFVSKARFWCLVFDGVSQLKITNADGGSVGLHLLKHARPAGRRAGWWLTDMQ